jgi:hypothetical protein
VLPLFQPVTLVVSTPAADTATAIGPGRWRPDRPPAHPPGGRRKRDADHSDWFVTER